eukprot:CAMPEP_0198281740 /NCGR_PEP_ID=MMETSP1449-20131203/1624_1 /TAXON_ID=420275 /ORGANISM="Attheya septentrionalis, Strain CCMP2084" /LENGTH=721 /DNA_ID=CAMNT_0043977643 /DNA_START=833 /DNA_END=2998 /DNA_ORIENTATION=-
MESPFEVGYFKTVLQHDGNLVTSMYNTAGGSSRPVFSTRTHGEIGDYSLAIGLHDCVLHLFKGEWDNPNKEELWSSIRTELKSGDILVAGDIFRDETNHFMYMERNGDLIARKGTNMADKGKVLFKMQRNKNLPSADRPYLMVLAQEQQLRLADSKGFDDPGTAWDLMHFCPGVSEFNVVLGHGRASPIGISTACPNRKEMFFHIFKTVSDKSSLLDPSTPQAKALTWIASEDVRCSPYNDNPELAIQRYTLAAMHYGLDGEEWNDCAECNGEGGDFDPPYWMTPEHECSWYFTQDEENDVVCDDDGIVTAINLQTGSKDCMNTGHIVSEIGLLKSLTRFDISSNCVTGTIPQELNELIPSWKTSGSAEGNCFLPDCTPQPPGPDNQCGAFCVLTDPVLRNGKRFFYRDILKDETCKLRLGWENGVIQVTDGLEVVWKSEADPSDPKPYTDSPVYYLNMQNDGNAVIRFHPDDDPTNTTVVWSSGTPGKRGNYFLGFTTDKCVLNLFEGTPENPGDIMSSSISIIDEIDIGDPVISGDTNRKGLDTFIVQGGGRTDSNTYTSFGLSDDFYFLYKEMTGSFQIICRMTLLDNDFKGKAGIMIRESLQAGASHVFAHSTPTRGHQVVRANRYKTNKGTSNIFLGQDTAFDSVWFRIDRIENDVIAYYAPDSGSMRLDWAEISPQNPTTIVTTSPLFAGLAVSSNDDDTVTKVKFDNVAINSLD